jgi:hypothetical protein
MDQSTEQVASAQRAKDRSAPRLPRHRRHGRYVTKAAVGTVPVVVLHIDPQHTNKLPAADDQQLVKTLSAHAADPPFGDGVGVGCLHRCADDLGTGRAPDVVECLAELGVPSRIRNLNAVAWSSRTATRLRACWATHHPVG